MEVGSDVERGLSTGIPWGGEEEGGDLGRGAWTTGRSCWIFMLEHE